MIKSPLLYNSSIVPRLQEVESNPFSLFSLESRPAVDLEALKDRFNVLTIENHPDKFQRASESELRLAEERSAETNRAYQLLIDPRARLLYLYELVQGEKPRDVQRIPPGTMDLFIEVAQTCRQLDEFLTRKQSATGALERAGLMSEELTLQDALGVLRGKLEALAGTLETDLQALDAAWQRGEREANALETLYRKYSYLARWRQQLEERELALLTGE